MSQSTSILRIAFLGADDQTPALARAAAADSQFEIVGVAEIDAVPGGPAGLPTEGRVRTLDSWEALLDSEFVDAVVVASGDDDQRAEQLRKFTQAGVPVLASHPLLDSMLVYYELDMIRRETGSLLLPALPERNHPAVEALAAIVGAGSASPIGKVEQVLIERHVAEPTRASRVCQLCSRRRHLAADSRRADSFGGDGRRQRRQRLR